MARLLFVGSFGLLVYSYCIYPLLLLCLPRRRQAYDGAATRVERWPFVSMVLAAYNEEKVIVEKIRNFLECGYPGPMEMVIVSDCSTDRTAELVRSYDDPRVHLIAQQRRAGKGAAVNQAIAAARGEILIFSDANSLFDPDTLIELVRPFADQRVGLVTGCTRYTKGTIGSLYQRYEQALKSLESRGGVVATADGAIYAMRRTLWRQYDPKLTNDFLHPILVSLEGADAIVAPRAVCDEEFSIDNEFARQVRMVSLASLVYLVMLPKLLLAGRWRSILVLTSHKLLRWLTVPLLALLAAASLWLAHGGGIYLLAALAEGAFALAVVAGALGRKLGTSERLTIPFQFVALNCAGALGLWRCLAGSVPVVWQPRKD
jgi:cellulose synthase/poly-beta-1,6-N-acetylglucosamine synthase-like glycosyltransferase